MVETTNNGEGEMMNEGQLIEMAKAADPEYAAECSDLSDEQLRAEMAEACRLAPHRARKSTILCSDCYGQASLGERVALTDGGADCERCGKTAEEMNAWRY
jgi:hypothetical protein